jgi:hypothetical protein
MMPARGAVAKMQKKMLGLSTKSDYLESRDDLRFNWRHTDGLERGSARQWAGTRWIPTPI